MLETGLTHRTLGADSLGFVGFLIGHRVEDVWVETPARRTLAPGRIHAGDHILVAVDSLLSNRFWFGAYISAAAPLRNDETLPNPTLANIPSERLRVQGLAPGTSMASSPRDMSGPSLTPPGAAFHRASALSELADRTFDVLVIGGGVTGAGAALDAAARGLRTALVERGDFASGTSSRSSKLVHGGLRYLRQGELGLVREGLTERQRLLRNAPHLVSPLAFLIPLLGAGGTMDRAGARAHGTALWLYDLCGGARIGHVHRRIGAQEARSHLPTLRVDRLVGAFVYHDARVDDARLTVALARTAVLDHGAVVANYAPVVALMKDARGQVAGARLAPPTVPAGEEAESGADRCGAGRGQIEVRASVVVNATGVWSDQIRALDEGPRLRPRPGDPPVGPSIRPARGVHVVLSRHALPCDMAAVLPVPNDRRTIFVVPWGDHVYVGTTDTDYDGPLDDPRCSPEDVSYLLDAVNAVVTRPVSRADVTGWWAGLRPLLAEPATATDLAAQPGETVEPTRTADLSRRHHVWVSDAGLVSVTGGKLTTYRRMAADAVDAASVLLGSAGGLQSRPGSAGGLRSRGRHPIGRSPTRHLRLRGADGTDELRAAGAAGRLGVDPGTLDHLVARYGGEARIVLAMAQTHPDLARPLVPGQAYLRAEAVYAVRYEMAQTIDDVLSRRTRAALHDDRASAAAAPQVAALMAAELGWSTDHQESQVTAFTSRLAAGRASARLSAEPEAEPAAPGEATSPVGP